MAKYVHRHTPTHLTWIWTLLCVLQYPGHAGNIHQYLHHSFQHPLHLCHLLLCEGKLHLIMLLFILLHFLLYKRAQLSFLSLCLAALPCCYADCVQEDCSVSHQQHTGGSFHHHPRLHLCLCQYGMQSCQITSQTHNISVSNTLANNLISSKETVWSQILLKIPILSSFTVPYVDTNAYDFLLSTDYRTQHLPKCPECCNPYNKIKWRPGLSNSKNVRKALEKCSVYFEVNYPFKGIVQPKMKNCWNFTHTLRYRWVC